MTDTPDTAESIQADAEGGPEAEAKYLRDAWDKARETRNWTPELDLTWTPIAGPMAARLCYEWSEPVQVKLEDGELIFRSVVETREALIEARNYIGEPRTPFTKAIVEILDRGLAR